MITLPRSLCIEVEEAVRREWLVANGIGGYASGTPAGINTRRYHGLLVAALKPPVDRTVLLSNISEDITIEDRTFYLGANEYPERKIYPTGFVYIEEFRVCDGIPATVFRLGDALLSKTVWMEQGHNTTYIRYTYLEGTSKCSLVLHPLCNYRDYHDMTQGYLEWNFGVDPLEGGCRVVARDGALPFWLTSHPNASFTHTGVWYWNHVYRAEIERGFTGHDDLYSPGVFRATLEPGESFTLVASTEPPEATSPLVRDALEREQARQARILEAAGVLPEAEAEEASDPVGDIQGFVAQLVRAADQFIVTRDVSNGAQQEAVPTVIAGYHWFTDWGRDTMISLPGLCLPTGRSTEAAHTVRAFARFLNEGLIPNTFPDSGEAPQYNTVDATLWLFATVDTLRRAGDTELARDLYPALSDIIGWHVRGTRYGIGVDPSDGLLRAGEDGVQLTWMDAKVDGWVVTPRTGKPVEINALWCNALRVMSELESEGYAPQGNTGQFAEMLKRAVSAFRERFWYADGGYLYDVIDGPEGNSEALRPNQLLAISLMPGLVSQEQARSTLQVVRARLLTPYGLRTLAPNDPAYRGVYEGDRVERDGAYHQGTVWTWLLGPYFDAVRATYGRDEARTQLRRILPALRVHLGTAGLGTISEIFDGNPPHLPKGCISQAWSVAEVLRLVWGNGSLLK